VPSLGERGLDGRGIGVEVFDPIVTKEIKSGRICVYDLDRVDRLKGYVNDRGLTVVDPWLTILYNGFRVFGARRFEIDA
jgi:hypothetical protein